VADSLDEAKAAFRAAWRRPLSEKGADEICSMADSLDEAKAAFRAAWDAGG
jgi:hypothetical protein